ncbi:ribonuclease HII [Candidatus Chlamydia corallus]|uniref:ribonuclease HII n=1 Tax=Candidatus Chlamydia corallus TaxID=2038470 RepID=UPI000C2FE911|nr:ribonuclease HII [Candidatus Chlamydia corallus]
MNTSTSEIQRFLSMTAFDKEVASEDFSVVAGIDEAGRGPLAGPVVASACILPKGKIFPGVNDSKKLTARERAQIRDTLMQDSEVFFGIGVISVERIDQVNILEATKEAMVQAISSLPISPDLLLVDGLYLSHEIPCKKIIQGDAKSASIAAASILAKEHRDDLMLELHKLYPDYGFDRHKGYGTALHLEAIRRYGPSPCHRKSFSPIKQMCATI